MQIMGKVTTLYPLNLPKLFTSFWGHFSFLSFELGVLPLACVFDSNFHNVLILATTAPIAILCAIAIVWLVLRNRLLRKGGGDLRASLSDLTSKSIRLGVMVLYTIYPLVSSTIFQTFDHDDSLKDGPAYLRADYSIERHDPTHKGFIVYAGFMSVLYCFGVPAASWYALNAKKDFIKKLQVINESLSTLEKGHALECHSGHEHIPQRQRQKNVAQRRIVAEATRRYSGIDASGRPDRTIVKRDLLRMEAALKLQDPWLFGLSPLYRDYEAEYWWFEIPKLLSTLTLCVLVTMLPGEAASQVFILTAVSTSLMVLFANTCPYLQASDDFLAQFCQGSLTFSMGVGLLEKASKRFQVFNSRV